MKRLVCRHIPLDRFVHGGGAASLLGAVGAEHPHGSSRLDHLPESHYLLEARRAEEATHLEQLAGRVGRILVLDDVLPAGA